MGIIIWLGLLVVLAILGLGVTAVVTKKKARLLSGAFAGVVVLLLGISWFLSSFTIVQGYEVGVPVTFGNVGKTTLKHGPHFVAPWTNVETYPIRPQSVPDASILARTYQGGQFTVLLGARWSVDPEHAAELYYQVKTGDEDTITKKVVDKALGQAVQNVFSTIDNQTAIHDRSNVEVMLQKELGRQLASFGIKADNLWLRQVEPDGHTTDTINQLTAQQQATAVALASQQTATQLAKAQAITAEGLRSAASQLPASLTPTQLQVLCLQSWERVMNAANAKGITVYTTPCNATGQVIAK